jgi:hypothetical protein
MLLDQKLHRQNEQDIQRKAFASNRASAYFVELYAVGSMMDSAAVGFSMLERER